MKHLKWTSLVWFFACGAWAQSSLQLAQPDWVSRFKEGWSTKLEIEGETTYGKDENIDGYAAEAELRVRKMWSKQLGLIVGTSFSQDHPSEEASVERWEKMSIGAYVASDVFSLKWKSQILFSYIPDQEIRLKELRHAILLVDTRTYFSLGANAKAKLRYKYNEFLTHGLDKGVDMRSSKLELSPALVLDQWLLGIQNKLNHKFKYDSYASSIEMAPFIKFDGKHFEPLVKVAFAPFISGDGRTLADRWEKKPVYSFELEVNY